ncbi:MAG: FecR domain-containing protein [bacterium]|nr:FecR domain-containing protein [bacterium]
MKTQEHRRFWLTAAVIAVLIVLPAAGEERVGQLSKVAGGVEITRAEDGRVDQARQVGPRVRGGSVFGGDVIATGAGASATLVFGDGTYVDLDENTRLTVKEVDLSQLFAQGKSDKPIGRTIKLLAGDIFSEIVEKPQIATGYGAPSGVAAVQGSRSSVSVRPGAS